jgi:hypothetical protein
MKDKKEERNTDQEEICKRGHARFYKYYVGGTVASLMWM